MNAPNDSAEHPAIRAVQAHVHHWNRMERESWVALFSPSVVFEDPVGSRPKHGLDAVHNSWDRSFVPGRRWTLDPRQIVGGGDEAAVVMKNRGVIGDRRVEVDSIEVFRVDTDGLIVHVRAFFDQPTEFALADYFTPDRTD